MKKLQKIRLRNARRKTYFTLTLTSMIDVFTILLVFLLQNYSLSEFKVTPPKNIELPQSSTQKDPLISIVIIATKDALIIDGKKILTIVDNSITRTDLKEELIVPLYNDLQEKKRKKFRNIN